MTEKKWRLAKPITARQVEVFNAVAKAGSARAAAAKLGVQRSYVSRTVRDLEARVSYLAKRGDSST